MACCKNKPTQMVSTSPQWMETFGQNMANMISGGLNQGATPMPQDLQQAWREAYSTPQSANWAMNIMPQMFGGQQFPTMQSGGQFPNIPFFGQGGAQGGMQGATPMGLASANNFAGGTSGMPFGRNMPWGFDPYQSMPMTR